MPDRSTVPPWHILGAGAIGTLFAHEFAAAGLDVVLLRREGRAGTLSHRLRTADGDRERDFATRGVGDPGPVRRLLVTLKAPAIVPALTSLAAHVAPEAPVVILANGCGYGHAAAAALPGRDLCRGVTAAGAYRASPGCTVLAGRGETRIGVPGRSRPAPGWFRDGPGALPGVHWDPAIARALWRKLAVNCAINGLTAIHGCRNGELLTRPGARRELDALVHEISAALRALGQGDAAGQLAAAVYRVLRATAGNRSSMLEDVSGGRETEVASINGYLCDRARALGIDLPRNSAVLRRVAGLQG